MACVCVYIRTGPAATNCPPIDRTNELISSSTLSFSDIAKSMARRIPYASDCCSKNLKKQIQEQV